MELPGLQAGCNVDRQVEFIEFPEGFYLREEHVIVSITVLSYLTKS